MVYWVVCPRDDLLSRRRLVPGDVVQVLAGGVAVGPDRGEFAALGMRQLQGRHPKIARHRHEGLVFVGQLGLEFRDGALRLRRLALGDAAIGGNRLGSLELADPVARGEKSDEIAASQHAAAGKIVPGAGVEVDRQRAARRAVEPAEHPLAADSAAGGEPRPDQRRGLRPGRLGDGWYIDRAVRGGVIHGRSPRSGRSVAAWRGGWWRVRGAPGRPAFQRRAEVVPAQPAPLELPTDGPGRGDHLNVVRAAELADERRQARYKRGDTLDDGDVGVHDAPSRAPCASSVSVAVTRHCLAVAHGRAVSFRRVVSPRHLP